jgi:hypothetical protein
MGGILHIGSEVLYGDVETLRLLLADHTGSDRSAAALLGELAVALRDGPVQHVVVLPAKLDDEEEEKWRLRITHAALEVEL